MIPDLNFEQITVDDISYFFDKNINVSILRLDKIHPIISGNKWFKLRFYIDEAKKQGKKAIVTYGGAWSNHIIAIAAACEFHGLQSIGIIRGEEPSALSFTLEQAKKYGMQLLFLSREDYQKKTLPKEFQTDKYYIINEGGYGQQGAKGAATILDHCKKDFTYYCCAVGTGTMMAGLINASLPDQQVIGFSTMKNNTSLEGSIKELIKNNRVEKLNWEVIHDHHFGGYAKYTPELISFMNDFYKQTLTPTDFVYTGKLFYGVTRLIEQDYFPPNGQILVIHSGGLQGNLSLPAGSLTF